jgi:hypothetical protein
MKTTETQHHYCLLITADGLEFFERVDGATLHSVIKRKIRLNGNNSYANPPSIHDSAFRLREYIFTGELTKAQTPIYRESI